MNLLSDKMNRNASKFLNILNIAVIIKENEQRIV